MFAHYFVSLSMTFFATVLAIGSDWWLPPDYAAHGVAIDRLFGVIFAVTVVILVVVQVTLVVFAWRYRARAGRAVTYTHGSRKLESFWTIVWTAILLVLAFASKRVWDNFRYSPTMTDPGRSKVLIIGQQFKWNVIYPGPDGKFGRYLQYPKPTDLAWPRDAMGKPTRFDGVPGPAFLPPARVQAVIGEYVDAINPLGKDFSDPDGKDDDYESALARTLYVPVDRPVEILVESKDVIHDFFLPNFRAQLYATPGMTGHFVFTPTKTTAELEHASRRSYAVAAVTGTSNLTADIDANSAGAIHDKFGWRYVVDPKARKPITIVRDGSPVTAAVAMKLGLAGITTFTAHEPAALELACLQICGAGHYTMQGRVVVLAQAEFDKKFPAAPYAR